MGGVKEPYASGQSGMESPASFEVTKAPAIRRTNVQEAVKTAYRCKASLYKVFISSGGLQGESLS
jgi:hypothetical protein